MPNLWIIFATGLLTGGLTCLAVQGGLLASLLAQRAGNRSLSISTILFFLLAKLDAYAILGLGLGALGSAFQLSIPAQAFLQFAVAIFMVGAALNLLGVHPIFRYFAVQPPRFLTRLVRDQSKSEKFFAPILLGAFTVFVPCGTTQAMMALAIGTGNAFWGAAVMATFVLGTMPLFAILGFAATSFRHFFEKYFAKVAATAIVAVAVLTLNGSLTLAGSPVTLSSIWNGVSCTVSFCGEGRVLAQNQEAASDEVTINFRSTGYQTDHSTVKAGSTVKLNLVNADGRGCIQAFTIPRLGIQRVVPVGKRETLTLNVPKEQGALRFTCSMGMFEGALQII